ncbi:Conjugative transposon protein TraJ [Sphingobacterium sp. PM2-P1-29]|nr:Conjugative transposon protein TraJ [Sphingobacterium sp. PM2-P1-29]
MKEWWRVVFMATVGLVLPKLAGAQSLAEEIGGLHGVLDTLYDQMMPMCKDLIGVGSGIAGFAALFYIGHRVWRHIANAEPVDFYPLFRPFVLGFCIINFSLILGLINGIMKPTVMGTASMVKSSNQAIEVLLQQKEEALKKTNKWQMYVGADGGGDRDKWLKYKYGIDADDEGMFESVGNSVDFALEKAGYNFRNSVKEWMSQVLEILFQAASLCINTLRTFQLIVLAILGPLVFGLAVFDGFQHTLTVWLARYINIFLWLPVANIFGAVIAKIQELMIQLDISQIDQEGNTFFSATDVGYIIFLIIGITGYFTVPSVANYIVNAAGGSALQQKASSMVGAGISGAGTVAAMGGGVAMAGASMAADAMGNAASGMKGDMASQNQSAPYFEDKLKGK